METVQILNEDNFLRRVPTFLPTHVKPDGSISRVVYKPNPKKDKDGLSGDLERLSSFEMATLNDSRFRLLRINIGVVRNDIKGGGLDVIHNPLFDNYGHCLMTGNITDGKAGELLKKSEEVFKTLIDKRSSDKTSFPLGSLIFYIQNKLKSFFKGNKK